MLEGINDIGFSFSDGVGADQIIAGYRRLITEAHARGVRIFGATLLPFLSSVFVPAASMPAGVRWFTEHQPFTPVVECLRALLAGYLWARAAFGRGSR